jgi:pimeloyl-ACP methyl ester carboxylesterase
VRASAAHLDHLSGLQATLTGDGELAKTKAAALLLHGGQEESLSPAAARQIAVLRMAPIARHLLSVGADSGLAVWRLLFRYRGWNTEHAHPLEDVRWAIRQLRLRHGDVPIVLIGHSMGGRAAVRAAGEPGVAGVLGLAPWLPDGEPREQLAGRRLLVVHGMRDRITSANASREFSRDVRPIATESTYIGLRRSGHGMVRRVRTWNQLTSDFAMHAGLGIEPRGALARAVEAGELVI